MLSVLLLLHHIAGSICKFNIILRPLHLHVICRKISVCHQIPSQLPTIQDSSVSSRYTGERKIWRGKYGRSDYGPNAVAEELNTDAHLGIFSAQFSGRLIPGCGHAAQKRARSPFPGSDPSSCPNPNRFKFPKLRHCRETLVSSL